ncbi:MAG TPA: head GIN domain-containing protein [Prolixibacteraceae bacterium]|nr:head GIN domain-containing protein [Prolixibacteraceae bacterium]
MKSKHLILFGILVVTSIMMSSCWFLYPSIRGNGHVTEEVRQVGDFDEIEVSRGMNVYINYGSPAKVVVVADNNLHHEIVTDEDGDVLKVYVTANIREAKEKKVIITIDKLTMVEASSGSNIYTQGPFTSKYTEIKASSGSNITMEFNAETLKAKCSSGANIILSGTSKESELGASSGANVKAEALKSDNCILKVSSGSNVFATVTNQLKAKASSGGQIIYYGNPTSTTIEKSSGGQINQQ